MSVYCIKQSRKTSTRARVRACACMCLEDASTCILCIQGDVFRFCFRTVQKRFTYKFLMKNISYRDVLIKHVILGKAPERKTKL